MKSFEKSEGLIFRPFQNALAVSDSQHHGINRLVKLSLVVEGKVIKYYKHFKLTQSTQKHHEFILTLAHDTLGERQTHTLEEANKFLGKKINSCHFV
ncbi:hypothetical protein SAMN05443633_105147 [Chryseobacterium arachidis]|uniref:Uncharacterized protein n=1 Tax=Chryseobacterium arachidis TaxID=1416778 RepID=A0A1M5D415_9FLAO|nr:hypothetical protein SAMN05443633_105147 [Chryseobacterium arachidis]